VSTEQGDVAMAVRRSRGSLWGWMPSGDVAPSYAGTSRTSLDAAEDSFPIAALPWPTNHCHLHHVYFT